MESDCVLGMLATSYMRPVLQSMEQRYTSLAEQQGRLAAEKDKLASANDNLQKVRTVPPVLIYVVDSILTATCSRNLWLKTTPGLARLMRLG
jgi:hypothetical protein